MVSREKKFKGESDKRKFRAAALLLLCALPPNAINYSTSTEFSQKNSSSLLSLLFIYSFFSFVCSASSSTSAGAAVQTYRSKKKATTVKPISLKDEKLLNQAIEIANEISAR